MQIITESRILDSLARKSTDYISFNTPSKDVTDYWKT